MHTLWTVDQVNVVVVVGDDGDGRESPCLGVVVHAFDDHDAMIDAMAFVCLPLSAILARVLVSHEASALVDEAHVLQAAVRVEQGS